RWGQDRPHHTFRGTAITAYLENGGTLEKARQMAAHASTRTTQLYDRREDRVALDEVMKINRPQIPRTLTKRSERRQDCNAKRVHPAGAIGLNAGGRIVVGLAAEFVMQPFGSQRDRQRQVRKNAIFASSSGDPTPVLHAREVVKDER